MISPWSLLKFVPQSLLTTVKRHSDYRLRFWFRERFGASYKSIPDSIVRVADGRRFHIGPEGIYWTIFMGLGYEAEECSIVRRLVRPGDTALDVGANFGWYTTLLAELVGGSGHVLAFEPVTSTYERLMENINLNEFEDRVTALPYAVGEQAGEVNIYVSDFACGSSLSTLDKDPAAVLSAPMVDLDTFLATKGVGRVSFLKCDVEGAELLVLKGAQRLLRSEDAPLILVELNHETSAAFGFQPADLWGYLRDLGYDDFFGIPASDRIQRVESRSEIEKVGMLLCGKRGRIDDLMANSSRAGCKAA